ncbi:MAG: SpoIIE family protein phosphatase [Opitutaceae bacterium]|nr:SpoIIE family protein phosphatase [Cytophagales bacterium]
MSKYIRIILFPFTLCLALFLLNNVCSGAKKGVLNGIVLTEGNEPIENALVVIDGVWQVLTNEQGEFSIPYKNNVEPNEVVGFFKGLKVKEWDYSPSSGAIKVIMTPGNVMAGIVRDETGKPLGNTQLTVGGFKTEQGLTTDKYGYFRLLLPDEASMHNAYTFSIHGISHNERHYTLSPTHAFYNITYSGIHPDEKKKQSFAIQQLILLRTNLKPISNTPVVVDQVHYLTDGNGIINLNSKVPRNTIFKLNGYTIIRSELYAEEEKLRLIVNVEKPVIDSDTISKMSSLDKDFEIILQNLKKEKNFMVDNNSLINNEVKKIQERISKGAVLSQENKNHLQNLLSQIQREVTDIHSEENKAFTKRDNELIFNLQALLLEKDSINKIVAARLLKVENEKLLEEAEFHDRILKMTIAGVILVLLAITGYVLALRIRKQKQQLAITNHQLEESKDKIKLLYEEQTDGIKLALVTQQAILPPSSFLENWLPDHFILYKPKDIVSGDFYWGEAKDGNLFLASVDCTGHGVAGGFTSMLGYSLLNLALQNEEIPTPAHILDRLNEGVIRSLRQGTAGSRSKDGMDITLIKYHPANNAIQVAGGGNPVYVVRNGEILQYKLDKFAIGVPRMGREVPKFSNFEIDIQKGDMVYIFTDGFADQLGGIDGQQKYMYNKFRELLVSISFDDMETQQQKLEESFLNWKGDHEQMDDITVIGIRV